MSEKGDDQTPVAVDGAAVEAEDDYQSATSEDEVALKAKEQDADKQRYI